MLVTFSLSCSGCSALAICPVLGVLLSFSGYSLHSVLPFCLILAALSRQSCPDSLVLAALFRQSFPGSPVLPVLFYPCSTYHVLPILFCLPLLPIQFRLSCSACPGLPVSFCLSCSACPALPVLFCLSCFACLVLPVLFCLSCFACLFLPVLF